MITIQKFRLYSLKVSAYVKISVECFENFGGANAPNVSPLIARLVQPISINIVFGCKQAQCIVEYVNWVYQSSQLEYTKFCIALVARAYHSYSRAL